MPIDGSDNSMGTIEDILKRYYNWDTIYKIPKVGQVQESHIRAIGDKKLCEEIQNRIRYKTGMYKIHKLPDGQYILINTRRLIKN